MSDITIRASVFGETLTHFFTHKEQRCFSPDGSNMKVVFSGGDADAFTLVLLHESTHVVDFALGISAYEKSDNRQNSFFRKIWVNSQELAPPYSGEIINRSVFREAEGGRPIEIRDAAMVYRTLATTPFVDLYATASEAEDLSSLVSFYELWKVYHVSPEIIVTDRTGRNGL